MLKIGGLADNQKQVAVGHFPPRWPATVDTIVGPCYREQSSVGHELLWVWGFFPSAAVKSKGKAEGSGSVLATASHTGDRHLSRATAEMGGQGSLLSWQAVHVLAHQCQHWRIEP